MAGTFVEPMVSSLLAAGALYKAKVDYKAARNKTLDKHSMSWQRWIQLRAVDAARTWVDHRASGEFQPFRVISRAPGPEPQGQPKSAV